MYIDTAIPSYIVVSTRFHSSVKRPFDKSSKAFLCFDDICQFINSIVPISGTFSTVCFASLLVIIGFFHK